MGKLFYTCIPKLFGTKEIDFRLAVLESLLSSQVSQLNKQVCVCVNELVEGLGGQPTTSYFHSPIQKRVDYEHFLTKAAKAVRTQWKLLSFSFTQNPATTSALCSFAKDLSHLVYIFLECHFAVPNLPAYHHGKKNTAFCYSSIEKSKSVF